MVSWWGENEPSLEGHPLHTCNEAATAIVAVNVSIMEETQVTDQVSTTWLNYIIRGSTKTSLVDIYSPNGKQDIISVAII